MRIKSKHSFFFYFSDYLLVKLFFNKVHVHNLVYNLLYHFSIASPWVNLMVLVRYYLERHPSPAWDCIIKMDTWHLIIRSSFSSNVTLFVNKPLLQISLCFVNLHLVQEAGYAHMAKQILSTFMKLTPGTSVKSQGSLVVGSFSRFKQPPMRSPAAGRNFGKGSGEEPPHNGTYSTKLMMVRNWTDWKSPRLERDKETFWGLT